MQHQLRLMALGEAGGGRDSSVIFDGSDEGKSFRAISFVGKAKPPGSLARDAGNPAAAAAQGPVGLADDGQLFRARGQMPRRPNTR